MQITEETGGPGFWSAAKVIFVCVSGTEVSGVENEVVKWCTASVVRRAYEKDKAIVCVLVTKSDTLKEEQQDQIKRTMNRLVECPGLGFDVWAFCSAKESRGNFKRRAGGRSHHGCAPADARGTILDDRRCWQHFVCKMCQDADLSDGFSSGPYQIAPATPPLLPAHAIYAAEVTSGTERCCRRLSQRLNYLFVAQADRTSPGELAVRSCTPLGSDNL